MTRATKSLNRIFRTDEPGFTEGPDIPLVPSLSRVAGSGLAQRRTSEAVGLSEMIEPRSHVIIWTQVSRINNLKALSGPQRSSSQSLLQHVCCNIKVTSRTILRTTRECAVCSLARPRA